MDVSGYHRLFVNTDPTGKAGHKYPLTLSIVGNGGFLYGIKVTIFDLADCEERGVFLSCTDLLWKKIAQETKKRKKYTNMNTLEENYSLGYIMKKVGWKVLKSALSIEKAPNGKLDFRLRVPNETGRPNGHLPINQIENFLNIRSVQHFYKNVD